MTLTPRGFIHSDIGSTVHGAGVIPPRVTVPERVEGFPLAVTDFEAADTALDTLVQIVNEKLRLEDDRIRRLLPDVPAGYSWRGEIQSEHREDFRSFERATMLRIVYRLYGPNGQAATLRGRETWASDEMRE